MNWRMSRRHSDDDLGQCPDWAVRSTLQTPLSALCRHPPLVRPKLDPRPLSRSASSTRTAHCHPPSTDQDAAVAARLAAIRADTHYRAHSISPSGKGEARPTTDLCNKATYTPSVKHRCMRFELKLVAILGMSVKQTRSNTTGSEEW
jgi:hypothetical protein